MAAFACLEQDTDLKQAYADACEEIDETLNDLRAPIPAENEDPFVLSELHSNFSKEGFEQAVEKAREYILAGDLIQVVLSQRLSGATSGDAFTLYRNLRSINLSGGSIPAISGTPSRR